MKHTQINFDYEEKIFGGEFTLIKLEDKNNNTLKLKYLFEILNNEIFQGKSVLEIGSGAGQFIKSVKYYFNNLNCYACDLSKNAIKELSTNKQIKSLVAKGENLPFKDESFDIIIFFDLLEHLKDPILLLIEIKRILKKDGILHCQIPIENNKYTLEFILRKFGIGKGLKEKYCGHMQQFNLKDIKKLLDNTNFTIIRLHRSSFILHQAIGIFNFLIKDLIFKLKKFKNPRVTTASINTKNLKDNLLFRFFNFFLIKLEVLCFYESKVFKHTKFYSEIHISAKKIIVRADR